MPVSSSISCPHWLRFDKQLISSREEETMDYPAGRDLYPKTRRQTSTMDALRYVMFCQQRKRKNEALPPTSYSLRQNMKRANYQAFIWRSYLVAMQDLQSPVGHGWELEDDCLKPVYMTKDPAPRSLIEITTCNCKRSQCQGNCSCYNSDLSCTEACLCMADETCKNPHTAIVQCDSESEEESDVHLNYFELSAFFAF